MTRAMGYLASTCAVDVEYGRKALDALTAVGLVTVQAEGRCAVVHGGSPPAAHFLALTLEKLRVGLIDDGAVTETEFVEAISALQDPAVSVVMPLTVAAWGWRTNL